MKKKLLISFIIIFVFASTGYSQPRVDTSSDEKMKASIAKVRESLPENRRHEFDEALEITLFSQVDLQNLFVAGATGVNVVEAKIKQSLNGKTAQEIIAQSAQIKKERKEAERRQVLSEIKELGKKQIKAQKDKDELSKFQIIRSWFYTGEIELTVKNGTQYPISRAYFKGTLASPGRSIPWLKDDFNYSIPGGLEPGEEATWELWQNMFSGWGHVEMHDDAIFTVEVEQLDGANNKALFFIKDFSERDMERLAELKKIVGAR